MAKFSFLIALFIASCANAGIFKCVDGKGNVTFSDEECSKENKSEEVVLKVNSLPFDEEISLDNISYKVIYEGSRLGRESRFLRVSVYEETDEYMIFYIEGYYNKSYRGTAEYRVMPNIHWSARLFTTTSDGVVKGYGRVALGSKAKDEEESDVITLQLWEYRKGKSHRILETQVIPRSFG